MPSRRTLPWLAIAAFLFGALPALTHAAAVSGTLLDSHGRPVPHVSILLSASGSLPRQTITDAAGHFSFPTTSLGSVRLIVRAAGFQPLTETLILDASSTLEIHLQPLFSQTIQVAADINHGDILDPDPAVKVFAAENLLDANPGRPGAPISIPGYPIETASGGIKAPQYFAPGVAGDHGEPIAQYVQVGSYLLPNNLSANAHGNGYADPNIFIASVIESVQVDGGAYNVREGNHALNLAATYGLRSHLSPFLTLIGDHRDLTLTAGLSPSPTAWIAAEGSYGNGFLDRLEHRRQFKLNGGRTWQPGRHTLTFLGIAYLGYGYVPGLRPIFGFNSVDSAAGWRELPDSIDPRQRDQTHTALAALNDVWKLSDHQQFQFSGFFRTYNLSLFSDFGLGLIRQSEFRTVTGASAAWLRQLSPSFTLLAGTDYQRDAPRRDDLDHYNFFNPAAPSNDGPFVPIDGNNVTIAPLSAFLAAQGRLGPHIDYYAGFRRDEIAIDNQDLLTPANSWNKLVGLSSPKATLTFIPGSLSAFPLVALSFGKSYFTEDPREGDTLNHPTVVDPVETARSYQLVAAKTLRRTDLKLTLGHETQTAEYGKIDPDQGLQFDLGPGRIRFLAATLRQSFARGAFQATFEQADARLVNTAYSIVPEAPRRIGDFTGAWQALPWRLQGKGEFEYVGQKVVGNGCSETRYFAADPNALNEYCLGVPNKEFRVALARSFLNNHLNVGLNAMLATGWTGQTVENFATASAYQPGALGLAPDGLVPANPVSEVVGVRMPSYASVNLTWRFSKATEP